MKLLLILVLAAVAFGQSVTIDAGGPNDAGYSSPAGFPTTAYTIPVTIPIPVVPPGTNDLTMRYGQQFTYHVTVAQPGQYTVCLYFIEPTVLSAGARVFSVSANDQPIIQNLDLFAENGYLVPTERSALVSIPGKDLYLRFAASVRNAVISLIVVTYSPGIIVSPIPPYVAGPTGAISILPTVNPVEIDIVTALVCLKTAACIWTGANDFSLAAKTAPFRVLVVEPAACESVSAEWYYNLATGKLKVCTAANVWTPIN